MSDYLYRVVIVDMPEGSLTQMPGYPEYSIETPGWAPEGWNPSPKWILRFGRGSDEFFWPSTSKEYKSRSGATARKKLIESYGATCIIQRSARIVWPEDGRERIPERTAADEIAQALGVLRKVGITLTIDGGAA